MSKRWNIQTFWKKEQVCLEENKNQGHKQQEFRLCLIIWKVMDWLIKMIKKELQTKVEVLLKNKKKLKFNKNRKLIINMTVKIINRKNNKDFKEDWLKNNKIEINIQIRKELLIK